MRQTQRSNNQVGRYNHQTNSKLQIAKCKIGYWLLVIGYYLVIVSSLLVIIPQSASSAELIGPTEDPTRIGVGARLMGMGKAFVGIADDGSAIFANPAGLAEINSWYLLSMYSSLLDEIPYLTLTYSLPFTFRGIKGGLGLGYVGSGVADIISPTQAGFTYFDYHNNVYLLSLAGKINKSLSLGLNFKYFDEGFTRTVTASGKGQDLDLGIKYIYSDWASFGLTLQNGLPASMGGVVNWGNYSETVPSILKVGGAFKFYADRLRLAIDNDVWLTRKLPSQLHIGTEWEISPILILRGGMDQNLSSAGDGVTSNPTFGMGLRLWGARFDYAYHPYSEEQGNITHFFSLSFSPAIYERAFPALPPPPPPKVIRRVRIEEPKDKLTTNEEKMIFKGRIQDKRVKSVKINGADTPFDTKGEFKAELSLHLGKNTIWIAGFDQISERIETQRIKILRLINFSDVPSDHWAKDEIEQLGTLGILAGYPDETFEPEKKMDRIYLLVELLNANGISTVEAKELPFRDVEVTSWMAPYLKAGYDAKIIYGYPDGTFRPEQLTNRVEGIVMIVRFSRIKLSRVLERSYPDLDARHWAIKEIAAAKENSLLKFVLENLYPKKEFTRAEFAAILSKTPNILVEINKLLDFETGYQESYTY